MSEPTPPTTANGYEIHESRDALSFGELRQMTQEYGLAGDSPGERLDALQSQPEETILAFIADLNRRVQGSEETLVNSETSKVTGTEIDFIASEARLEVFTHTIDAIKTARKDINPARAGDTLALATVLAHPFVDGNGRTARLLGFMYRDDFDTENAEDTFARLVESRNKLRAQGENVEVSYMPLEPMPIEGTDLVLNKAATDLSDPEKAKKYIDTLLTSDRHGLYMAPESQPPLTIEKALAQERALVSRAAIERVSEKFSEIAELKSPDLQTAVDTLAREFNIRPEFFVGEKGSARTLLLASVASNLVQLEKAGKTPMDNFYEFAMLADATAFIALDFIDGYDDLVKEAKEESEGVLSESAKEQILHKYRSKELTLAMEEKVKAGLLDTVKHRLGITAANEDPYTLVVLSIAQDSERANLSIGTPIEYATPEEEDSNLEAARAKDNRALENYDFNKLWGDGLVERRKRFEGEFQGGVATAFVEKLNGTTYLCMPADLAELIVYDGVPDQRTSSYDKYEQNGAQAYLEHEYTHTQGFTALENLVGISLEEYRAELFSDNRLGYTEVKFFFQDMYLTTGFSLQSALESRPKGGGTEALYGDIAANVGLDMLVKIATVLPASYARDQSSALTRGLNKVVGGYGGIVAELHNRAVESGEGEKVDQRIDAFIASIGAERMIGHLPYRSSHSPYGAKLIQDRLEQQTT